MATTPNYGWVTPAPTDFVTDLPADFETFADAVDADLAGLLGGTTGQVLTKDSASDHDFSWQDASGGGIANWTLLNAGGTALTGASTITVSGISNAKQILVIITGASAGSGAEFRLRPNNDSGTNYTTAGQYMQVGATYSSFLAVGVSTYSGADSMYVGGMSSNTAATVDASIFIDSADQTGWKRFHTVSGSNWSTSGTAIGNISQGIWEASAAITSISLVSNGGNFDSGTIYVLGAS